MARGEGETRSRSVDIARRCSRKRAPLTRGVGAGVGAGAGASASAGAGAGANAGAGADADEGWSIMSSLSRALTLER